VLAIGASAPNLTSRGADLRDRFSVVHLDCSRAQREAASVDTLLITRRVRRLVSEADERTSANGTCANRCG